ncbi:unnamed protein product [Oppiella nova]|uniref:UDP-glucose 4-epimerase n=1 Tax=Oppiella nova TaxID=334625 RepID=A0A7R9ME08_9ACAR|nr:unnamed protein product [Oppiella nova]CAG2174436.1 unnamed protein product [Oppiella nova]
MCETILVTGGAGYVGSHCVLEFLLNKYDVIVVDNLVNSVRLEGKELPESLIQVERLTNRKVKQYINGDLKDESFLDKVFTDHKIDVVVHFAALKSVGESVAKPLEYYENNVSGTIKLLKSMRKFGVKKLIFSSSATVYGDPQELPLVETSPTGQTCTNPYGRTKHMIIKAFESANGIKIPYKIVERRPGDVTALYADSQLALEKLEWRAVRSLQEMCASAWKWQSNHPNGYNTKK